VRVGPDRDDSARMLQFVVEDNGVGMENADTIFQEGVKLDRDAATRQSTGMGLAFCKSIVDAHHGRIWFDTKVGEGSTFYFTIPIASIT
jgi:two-component system, chemotaxis family, sensor kinase Cph1